MLQKKKLHFKKLFQNRILGLAFFLGLAIYLNASKPVRNLTSRPDVWNGDSDIIPTKPKYDSSKKTVFIIADYEYTEIVDMLAPFYLFNKTGQTNVYVVAKDYTPIVINRDLFVMPQLTFSEAEAMHIQPDVIVIPALSKRTPVQDTFLITWIRDHFMPETKLLTICDGAVTGAATGLFDGKPITCHASDFDQIKAQFSKPQWVKDMPVTKCGNLFSTAGVSNAVEGTLVVINELFGRETLKKLLSDVHYPEEEIRTSHQSIALTTGDKVTFLRKAAFNKNKRIGLLLENGMNEFEMASLIDTYNRTLPYSFSTFNFKSARIQTKFGLTLVTRGKTNVSNLDELHIFSNESLSEEDAAQVKDIKIVSHTELQRNYPFDAYFQQIGKQYGKGFADVVKISLDYN
jgi:transcriptional regulator GlxA family with amidase domain